jgi:hypothetical protein
MISESGNNIPTMAGAIIALFAFVLGLAEYVKQGKLKRAEFFEKLRLRYKSNESIQEICVLLEQEDKRLKDVKFRDKLEFLGFYEEVAIMVNSRIIKKRLAHYMFGYYAIRCWDSKYFWYGLNKESDYWQIFQDYASRLKKIESDFGRLDNLSV